MQLIHNNFKVKSNSIPFREIDAETTGEILATFAKYPAIVKSIQPTKINQQMSNSNNSRCYVFAAIVLLLYIWRC